MKSININEKQASEFAAAIFQYIGEYVKTHQKEFEEFLKEEEKSEGGDK